ncbi:phage GP46 family protein [bacterium]|nr:phage GP46 family protein [bacterium]
MDFLLNDTGDGGEFELLQGDIKGDDTFYTAVYLSLFGGESFYNIYSKYNFDTSFEEALCLPITSNNLRLVETKANNFLQWLIDEEIASKIEVFAYGDRQEKINVEITIIEPDSTTHKYSIIWQNEKRALKRIN